MRIGMVADGVQRTMIRPLFFYNLLCKPFSSSSFLAKLEEMGDAKRAQDCVSLIIASITGVDEGVS